MSAGSFVTSKYASDYGNGNAIHPIRVQPETLSAAVGGTENSPPAGAVTNPISAVVSRSRRGLGLMPRTVRLRFPNEAQPTGYKAGSTTVIPAVSKAFWNACTKGASVTYLGASCTVVGRNLERAE